MVELDEVIECEELIGAVEDLINYNALYRFEMWASRDIIYRESNYYYVSFLVSTASD